MNPFNIFSRPGGVKRARAAGVAAMGRAAGSPEGPPLEDAAVEPSGAGAFGRAGFPVSTAIP